MSSAERDCSETRSYLPEIGTKNLSQCNVMATVGCKDALHTGLHTHAHTHTPLAQQLLNIPSALILKTAQVTPHSAVRCST
jgi:hypothetical protein